MEFDWADYKILAEHLRKQSGEAAKRSAISRIYYCVFHQAQNYLKEKHGFQDSFMGEGSHKRVWGEYFGKGRSYAKVHDTGKRLRDNRNKADYNPKIEKLDDLVEETFIDAEKVLVAIEGLRKGTSS